MVSAIYAGWALQKAFSSEYVVQDDARVYLIWMQRFLDADLLRGDLIADYLQSVTPWGYATLYRLMATVGIPPLLFSKLLPMVLGLLTTGYGFAVCLQLLPIPMAGFISTLLLNQSIWLKDDIVSATPRGFLYPLLLAFLYYLLKRSWLPVCLMTVLLALFYPVGGLLASGVLLLQLVMNAINQRFQNFKIQNPFSRKDYLFCLIGLGIVFLVMLAYVLSESQYGPTVTAAEARTWREFLPGGRMPFFKDADPFSFWLTDVHSSIGLDLNPLAIASGFLLPLLMRYPSRFPLVKQITSRIRILPQLLLVSLCWFFTAHALLFRLYFPSRYMMHSLRIVLALSAGIVLSAIWHTVFQGIEKRGLFRLGKRRLFTVILTLIAAFFIIFYPQVFWQRHFPETLYVVGEAPKLYEFLQKQPKDTVIASLAEEGSSIPIFAQRSTLVSKEYANPYHLGYYRQFRQRAIDLIQAQYSPKLSDVQRFIQKYRVSFLLLDSSAFTPQYLTSDRWRRQHEPAVSEAVANLEKGTIPALAQVSDRCSVLQTEGLILLQAQCILDAKK